MKLILRAVFFTILIAYGISRFVPPVTDSELTCMENLGLTDVKGLVFISCVVSAHSRNASCTPCSQQLTQSNTRQCIVKKARNCLKAYCP
ncbi:hypothetical protein Q1695_009629 [Nippostrongylus brasiliensis]|nr:hypothetical protein Q1695_009629 [Nippostrongylus brasiliensis]